jgi:hypothetical protein
MPFKMNSLFQKSVESIRDFSSQHANETFYAFAIDENLLCLNSVEEFEKTLCRYREKDQHDRRALKSWVEVDERDIKRFDYKFNGNHTLDRNNLDEVKKFVFEQHNILRELRKDDPPSHQSPGHIALLRASTGDWCYQGFASFSEADGFDFNAYYKFNDLDGDKKAQARSEYGVAMKSLIQMIEESGILGLLNRTPNFYSTVVSHYCVEVIE